jgi:hypothetical protein
MRKYLLLICIITALSTALIACSNDNKASTSKSFDSEDAALKDAQENTSDFDKFLGETKYIDDEKILVYSIKNKSGEGVGTITLTQEDKKITWTPNNNPVILKQKDGKVDVKGDIETPSGKKFNLYAGIADDANKTINTKVDYDVKPHIDSETNIYYLVYPDPSK